MAQIDAVLCNKEFLGTGALDCELFLNQQWSGIILVPKTWSISKEDLLTFDKDKVVDLIQQTTFDPLFNAVEFTDNTPEATTEEFTGGIMTVTRNGLPQSQFVFRRSVAFHQAAYSKNSYATKNVIFVDLEGNMWGAWNADRTSFKGLNMGMFNVETLRPAAGDTSSRTIVNLQLIDVAEFNKRLAGITAESLGFNIQSDVMPIINTTVTITEASVADGISFTVMGRNNTTYGIGDFVAGNFRFINQTTNTAITPTTVVDGTNIGEYVADFSTGFSAGNKVYLELYDATATPPVATAKQGDIMLYKGLSNTVTVAASIVGVFAMVFSNTFA